MDLNLDNNDVKRIKSAHALRRSKGSARGSTINKEQNIGLTPDMTQKHQRGGPRSSTTLNLAYDNYMKDKSKKRKLSSGLKFDDW